MTAKFWTGAIAGLAFGLIGAFVASNMQSKKAVPPAADKPVEITETFHMVAPDDGIATTHSGDKPLPLYPAGIGTLS
ncbi:MAG TPA: hypothetical protein VFH33_05795, partial [Candidatus Krumholzibacteria bacterium]|nr:hypothetical protein [Candidatus Krumholzibacteria bacterium]